MTPEVLVPEVAELDEQAADETSVDPEPVTVTATADPENDLASDGSAETVTIAETDVQSDETSDHDVIFGGAGNDWLFGGGGDDFIFGNMSPLEDELLRGVISGRFAV